MKKLTGMILVAVLAGSVSSVNFMEGNYFGGTFMVFVALVFVSISVLETNILVLKARKEERDRHTATLEKWHKEKIANQVVASFISDRKGRG